MAKLNTLQLGENIYDSFPDKEARQAIENILENSLPEVSTEDDNKILQVVGGKWIAVSITNGNEVAY